MSISTLVEAIAIPPESKDISISICVMVDGKPYFVKSGAHFVRIENSVVLPKIELSMTDCVTQSLSVPCGDVKIEKGCDIHNVETTNGIIYAQDILNDVRTSNGDVTCNDIAGNASTTNGDISAMKIGGSATSSNGDVTIDGKKQPKKRERSQISSIRMPGITIESQHLADGAIGVMSGNFSNVWPPPLRSVSMSGGSMIITDANNNVYITSTNQSTSSKSSKQSKKKTPTQKPPSK